jgi:hypothetical protein
VGFVVDEVTLAQDFSRILPFPLPVLILAIAPHLPRFVGLYGKGGGLSEASGVARQRGLRLQ